VLAHLKRKSVDIPMGLVLLAGGVAGAAPGIWAFNRLKALGQIDLVVQLSYVLFLGFIGALMAQESLRAWHRARSPNRPRAKRHQHNWVHNLPLKMKFRTSGLYISVIPPLLVGLIVGVLAAIMGVGGGFIMVPVMVYLLRMPMHVVVGTSLFQILFTCVNVTVLQAAMNRTVDFPLALVLLVGSTSGAQVGARISKRLKADQLKIMMAGIILAAMIVMVLGLVIRPATLLTYRGGH
jgi:hypothetical protein